MIKKKVFKINVLLFASLAVLSCNPQNNALNVEKALKISA
jgi:hypothetical protein